MGEDALKNGIPVGVSSWRQRSFNAIPPAVKSSASYMNSILAKLEAKNHGYAEAVMLNEQGYVCEGTGENLFTVRNGILSTPPLSDGRLRASLVTPSCISLPTWTFSLSRNPLRAPICTSPMRCSCAVPPLNSRLVRSVDDREIGPMGPITKKLQERYFEVAYGKAPEYEEWITRF